MKKLRIALFLAVIAALLTVTVAFALFTNGNFENGNFDGWTIDLSHKTGGIALGPPPSYIPASGPSVDDTFIVNAAWMTAKWGASTTCDPNTNGNVCLPYDGNDSAVVNYLGANYNLNKLSQSGLVASGDVGTDGMYHIYFAYAPVLDKGSHGPAEQPFIYVRLIRVRLGSPDKVLFDKFSYPDDGNPNWRWNTVTTSIAYMPWQVYDLTYAPAELGPGDTLTLDVVAAGCSQSGHWGYMYIDDFGPTRPGTSTAPSLTSVSPAFGPIAGGTAVTITGTGFTGATAVTIGTHTLLAGSFTVVNDTTITFTTPANPAIVVDVGVTNPGGSAVKANGFTYYVIPTITGGGTGGGTAPNAGPVTGGTNVVITGTGLAGGAFTFDGTTTDCIVNYAGTQATCPSPAHAAGSVDVVVTNPHGDLATSINGFTYYEVPTITGGGVSPNVGPVTGNTSVTITGTDFIGTTSVIFGSTAADLADCTVVATSITCPTPAHGPGLVNVVVNTLGGPATSTGGFNYFAIPTITGGGSGGGVSSDVGPIAGGTSVTIIGTNFIGTTSVTFGGAAANLAACSVAATSITCSTPAHSAGTVDVTVETPGGSATSTGGFTYYDKPTITTGGTGGGVSPHYGPVTGGTSVTITGTNLTGTSSVTFGGTAVNLAACSVAATSITCFTPAHASGTVDVVVTTPGGSDTSTNGFIYYEVPTITGGGSGGGIAPDFGPVTGGTSVTITGTNLISTTSVTFGGTAANLAACSVAATSIVCPTPAHAAGAVDVVVTTPGGSATSTGGFTYYEVPSITGGGIGGGLAPDFGPVTGGTSVVITGTNLISTTSVTFGGTAANLAACSLASTSITCPTPAHAAGPVNVVVTSPGGPATSIGGFTYYEVPTIPVGGTGGGVLPHFGPLAGGTTVVIAGTHLTGGIVTFGGNVATCTVDSATQITCATPGPHIAGLVNVVVTTPGGTTTSTGGFSYVSLPTITGIAPRQGPLTGGTSVVVTGTDLSTVFHVEFGATPTTCTVNSNTQITCTSPAKLALAGGGVDVDISTAGGTVTTTNGFTYIAIAPNLGPTPGGTHVTITGAGLTGGKFYFGGYRGSCTVNINGTLASCTTPAGLAGPKDVMLVTTGDGTITVDDGFTYISPPTIDCCGAAGCSPSSGSTLGGETVLINGTNLIGGTFTFGGIAAVCTVNPDGTQASCITPAHAPGIVDVVVTNAGGTAKVKFTYINFIYMYYFPLIGK